MDLKTAIEASRRAVPVVYDGIEYERISARITRVSVSGEETYSLELADYCGSAVMIVPIGEVELAKKSEGET